MLANDADVDGCVVVELEGQRAPDIDFDADQGALLLIPQAIRACAGLDRGLLERVRVQALEPSQQSPR